MGLELRNMIFDYCERHALSLVKSNIDGLDFVINNGNSSIGIIIKDWNRAIGVDVVIQAERSLKEVRGVSRCLILTNSYSDPAKALSKHISVTVFNRKEFEEKKNAYKL